MRAATLSLVFLLATSAVSAAQTSTPVAGAPVGDVREDFETRAYLGLATDTFGSQEIDKYLNPEENGATRHRSLFGFDFEYRLASGADRDRTPQLWIYAEARHGVRSEDLECAEAPRVPSCARKIAERGGTIPGDALLMLRNARSLEASFGGRLELMNVNLPGSNPARLYVKGQMGFINLAGSDGDGKESHHVAVGAIAVGGPRTGSYLEAGFGRNDLFQLNRYRRFKVDAMLQQSLGGGVNLFARFLSDVDFQDGSDAIQSFVGLSFNLGRFVQTIQNATK